MEIVKGVVCSLNVILVLITFLVCVKENTETRITGAFIVGLLTLNSALIVFGA